MARNPDPAKKEKFLCSAIQLFTENGYNESTIADIAKHAGLTASNAYIYYNDKEDLLLAAVQRMIQEHSEVFANISQNSIGQDPNKFVDICFDELEKIRPRIMFIMRNYLAPELSHVFKNVDLDYSKVFTPYLNDLPEEQTKTLTRSLMALSDSFFLIGDKESVKKAAVTLLRNYI